MLTTNSPSNNPSTSCLAISFPNFVPNSAPDFPPNFLLIHQSSSTPTMSLKDLPNELTAAICEITEKDVLMALRLTGKCISISATKSFSDRFLNSFSGFLTAFCLTRLIEICEHKAFGPGVRKIYLASRHIIPDHIDDGMIQCDRLARYRYYTDQDEEVARAQRAVQHCTDRYKDEQALEQEGRATKLLTRAFTALEAWGHGVELSIVPTIQDYDAIFLRLDCIEIGGPDADAYRLTSTFQPCLEAIRVSKMRVRKLDVSVKMWTTNHEELDFDLKTFSQADMKPFSMLTSITFDLKQITSYATVRAMAAIVSQARELETLNLSHCDEAGPSALGIIERWDVQFQLGNNASKSIKSDRIKSLSFSTMSFSKQCLLDFLHNHRNTIKTLRLSRCKLGDGSWHDLIGSMKALLPLLSTLNINYLYDSNSPSDQPLSILGFGETWVKGESKVQAALSAMIRRPLDNQLAPPANEQDEAALNT